MSANSKSHPRSPYIQSCLVQDYPTEAFLCASPILKLHARRTGEAGKSIAQKVGYAKVLHTFKNPLFFTAKMIWEKSGHCWNWGSYLHNPRSLLQQAKARTGGAEGGSHMAHAKAGKGKEDTGGTPKQLIQGFPDWKFKVNIQTFLLPIAVVSFSTWLYE